MMTLVILLFSFLSSASSLEFSEYTNSFAQSRMTQAVLLPKTARGVCYSKSGETVSTRLVKAYKTVEQNLGAGHPRKVREYRFAIYAAELRAFQAKNLLLERDWKSLDPLSARDLAKTNVTIGDRVQFVYEARWTDSGELLLQVRNQETSRIRLGAEEVEAQKGEILYNCAFRGVQ